MTAKRIHRKYRITPTVKRTLAVSPEKHFDILGPISSVYLLSASLFFKNSRYYLIHKSIYSAKT